MPATPVNPVLPLALREMFAGRFDKDLRFFQLLLVLINKSCSIKNVDLVWTEDAPPGRAGLRPVMGTTQAIQFASLSHIGCSPKNPNPRFCQLISDEGRHEAESCNVSDKAAEMRVRATGKTDIYRCHAGLIDIAVPVICKGKHIATLYSGQVLKAQPSRGEFVQIKKQVAHLDYLDVKQLEQAYWQVPVVTQEEIDETVAILEMFAEYLATWWNRLGEAVHAEQRRMKDLQLQRTEFAQMILEGAVADPARLRELARSIGFAHYPNRIFVVQPADSPESFSSEAAFDMTMTRVLHAVESTCEGMENVAVTYSRRRGICIFYHDESARTKSTDSRTYAFAQRIVNAVAERCNTRVRIGAGRTQTEIQRLQESYQEARAALAGSEAVISVYKRPDALTGELYTQLDAICRMIQERRLVESRASLIALPMLVRRRLGDSASNLSTERQFFLSGVEAVLFNAAQIGYTGETAAAFRSEALEHLSLARTSFQLHEAWISAADRLIAEMSRLYAGKYDKLVERTKSYVDRRIESEQDAPGVTLQDTARSVGVSAGHLSRVFRKVTGVTFERYLMTKRVERAQRLLLDPTSRVSEVAEKCEFCNPAYFARVFRKIAGCSPTEYSKNPLRYSAAAPTAADGSATVRR